MRAPRTVVAAPANATAAAYAPTVRGVRQATARTTAPAGAPITVTALQIRLRADASTLMSGYRRIAIHLTGDDGRPVAGPDLFTWAGIPLRERTEDLRRHLTVEVGGHGNSQLCVASFDDAAAWLAERGIGTDGWAHVGHGEWVPAKPDSDHPELCGRHAAGRRRSAQSDAQHQARMTERAARDRERTRRRRTAADWAQRLRDDFHLDVRPGADGGVELSGEGLHALFRLLDAELGADTRAELTPRELRARPGG